MLRFRSTVNRKRLRGSNLILGVFSPYVVLLLFTVLVWSRVVVEATLGQYVSPAFLDERYYLKWGLDLIRGADPLIVNVEHPPLAKYFFGLVELLGVGRAFTIACYALVVLGVYAIAWKLCNNEITALLTAFACCLDLCVACTLWHFLLDTPMLVFLVWSLYFFLCDRPLIGGLLAGLSIACKWPAAFALVPWLLYYLYRRRAEVLACVPVYVASYWRALMLHGLLGLVEAHLKALRYHCWRHGFSLIVALNGWLGFLFKVSLWNMYHGTLSLIINGSKVLYSPIVWHYAGRIIIVSFLYGSPLALMLLYAALRRLDLYSFSALSSLLVLFFGEIAWYYALPFVMLYPCLSRLGAKWCGVVAVVNALWFALAVIAGFRVQLML